MGGGLQSKIATTDWEASRGGIKEAAETLDKSFPTRLLTKISLVQKALVDNRAYDVVDDDGKKLYETRESSPEGGSFDVLAADGTAILLKVRQVSGFQAARKTLSFAIYTVVPNWESQEAQQVNDENTQGYEAGLITATRHRITWEFSYHRQTPNGLSDSLLKGGHVKGTKEQFQTWLPWEKKNLAGHIRGGGRSGEHKMILQVAAESDVAAQCIIALLAHLIYAKQSQ